MTQWLVKMCKGQNTKRFENCGAFNKDGKAKVTDFGLARVVAIVDSHVSSMVARKVGYFAPKYGHT